MRAVFSLFGMMRSEPEPEPSPDPVGVAPLSWPPYTCLVHALVEQDSTAAQMEPRTAEYQMHHSRQEALTAVACSRVRHASVYLLLIASTGISLQILCTTALNSHSAGNGATQSS